MALDKSKYVAKDRLYVRIQTVRENIVGYVHVLIRHRASDLLNDESRFIPVTDAVVTPLDQGSFSNNVGFIAVNKDHIVSMTEEEFPASASALE